MSNVTNDQLLKTVQEMLEWSKELEEELTGTTPSKVLALKRETLGSMVEKRDLEKAATLVDDLILTCNKLERK